jgi:methionyl-tRNA formyltransferase
MSVRKILLLTRHESISEILPSLSKFGDVTVLTDDLKIKLPEVKVHFDIGVSFSYAPIIDKIVLDTISFNIVNVHPTFLPFGRGIYPILWSAVLGKPQGASIHLIDGGIDTGSIYARTEVKLNEQNTLEQCREILISKAKFLLLDNFNSIVCGELRPTPQTDFGPRQDYRSREEGLKLLSNFPKKWDTTLKEVAEFGKFSGDF